MSCSKCPCSIVEYMYINNFLIYYVKAHQICSKCPTINCCIMPHPDQLKRISLNLLKYIFFKIILIAQFRVTQFFH